MSTPAIIAYHKPDTNTMQAISVYWDGYPAHVGYMLLTYYFYPARIEELMGLGDLSALLPRIEPQDDDTTHSFDTPTPGVTIAYGRDRGETDVAARVIPYTADQICNINALNKLGGCYLYLFDQGHWTFCQADDFKFRPLRYEQHDAVKAELLRAATTTMCDEPQYWLALENGKSIEVTFESYGLEPDKACYTIRLHAADDNFDEYDKTNGLLYANSTDTIAHRTQLELFDDAVEIATRIMNRQNTTFTVE